MIDHEGYGTHALKGPPAQILNTISVVYPRVERTELIEEIFSRLESYPIVRINGTPASGKSTLMSLIVNSLLKKENGHKPIYVMIGWDQQSVDNAGGWANYLEKKTGVNGYKWPSHSGYLFLDEAQMSYSDVGLWSAFFKIIVPDSQCRVLLFTSYGSLNRGFEGFSDQEFNKTPMNFAAAEQISLKPDYTVTRDFKPVGLLLDESESMNLVGEYMKGSLASIFTGEITEECKSGIWKITQGHAGLITSFCDALKHLPNLRPYRQSKLTWDLITGVVFKDPITLFRKMRDCPFARGLPRSNTLQDPVVAKVLKQAILYPDEVIKSSFIEGSLEFEALRYIWKNGWLSPESVGNDTKYVFATDFHKWFCACVFTPMDDDRQPLPYQSPLDLAKDVVKMFNPRQLSEPERAMNRNIPPLEDQYTKEFYRCMDLILKGRMAVSPEFAVNYGTQDGNIDFFIPDMSWGIELLRDNDRILEHLARFKPGGQYYPLVHERHMDQWIVLNCTKKRPCKKRTEYLGRLYHVVFTDDFRTIEVLRADLEIESVFSLLENHSHSFLAS